MHPTIPFTLKVTYVCVLSFLLVTVSGVRSALAGEESLELEIAGFARDGADRAVWFDLDWDPSGERGLALPANIEALEVGADGTLGDRHPVELLLPANDAVGRAALVMRAGGDTSRGQRRHFVVRPASDAEDRVAVDDTMQLSRDGDLLRIANRWYEITHDSRRGGMIVSVDYASSDVTVPVMMRDGFHGFSLADDGEPDITVRGGDGSLAVIVEVEADLARGDRSGDGLRVLYRYRYEADSPLVRVEAIMPGQAVDRRYTNLRLLEFDFDVEGRFEQNNELIAASSGEGVGEVMPREVSIGGDHRPRAGTLWANDAEALAMIHPAVGDDFVHEWMGQRQSLSATLYFGPTDRAEDDLALGTSVRATASVPRWRERIDAGLAAASEVNGGVAAVARTLFHAARQRMQRIIEPATIEHLIVEGEGVLAEASETAHEGAVAAYHGDQFIALANAHTALLFQIDGAAFWLDGLYRGDHGFVMPADSPRTLWHAWFVDNETGNRVWAASTRARDTAIEVQMLDDEGRALTWQSHASAGSGEVTVQGRIALRRDDALSRWSIDVQPKDDRLGLWEVAFPLVGGVRPEPTNEAVDYITTPGYLGRVPNPVLAGFHDGYQRHRIYRRGQYRGYYQGGAGFYIGAHDPDLAPVGTLTRNTGRQGIEFSYLHPTEQMGRPGTGLALSDRLVIGTFEGHWYHAAQIYRNWLEQQSWFPSEPLHANPDVPEWAKQAVVSHRGAGEGVIERNAELGEPPALTWYYHAWHQRDAETQEGHPSPKFAGTPDYPVPDDFEHLVALTQREGIHVGAYTLNTWWDYTAASWEEEGAEDAVAHLLGYDRPMYHASRGVGIICHATDLWRDKQGRVGANLAQTGVDGTYLDLGGGARLPFLCFAENHGHPPGGGGFMAAAKREAMQHFRESAREHNPDFVLISEGSAGYFLTAKDGFIEFVSSTPVAATLFFDYLRPLGNKRIVMSDGAHVSGDPHNAVTPAKHFAWGSSIGRFRGGEWHQRSWSRGVSRLETIPEDLAYYRNLVWHKYVARPWLNLGRMLAPLEVTRVDPSPPRELFEDTFVPSAVWEAPDGRIALVFANGYHGKAISFQYMLDPADYGLATDGTMALYQLTPAGDPPDVEPSYEFVEVIHGRTRRVEMLPPGGVLILVAMPAPDDLRLDEPGAAEPQVPEPDLEALEL